MAIRIGSRIMNVDLNCLVGVFICHGCAVVDWLDRSLIAP